jgi:rubrerythrin
MNIQNNSRNLDTNAQDFSAHNMLNVAPELAPLWAIRMNYEQVYALLQAEKIDGYRLEQSEEFCNPSLYRHAGFKGQGEVEIPAFRSLEQERKIALSLDKADEDIEDAKWALFCENCGNTSASDLYDAECGIYW